MRSFRNSKNTVQNNLNKVKVVLWNFTLWKCNEVNTVVL